MVATVLIGLQTCAKVLQMHPSGGGETRCLQPKINVTFKQGSLKIFKFMAADFGFKCFHESGHCAHRVANLCKSAANTPFRGWGDTLLATQN